MLVLTFGGALAAPRGRRCPLASFAGRRGAVVGRVPAGRGASPRLFDDVLLLAGVTLNSLLSALILLVQYFADMTRAMQTLRWLLGDLDVASYQPLVAALPMLVVAMRHSSCGCRGR